MSRPRAGVRKESNASWLLKAGIKASIVALSVVLSPVFALEFSGYLRTGIGETSQGRQQRCFFLLGARSKYRLGNECEHLSELSLRGELIEFAGGSSLSAKGMGLFLNQYGKSPNFKSGQADNFGFSKLSQAYLSWDNIPALNGGSFWAGRKYYRRNGIHSLDFFYWNPTGLGVGAENIRLGRVHLSYAFFRRSDNVLDKRYVSRHDLQLSGLRLGDHGLLEAGFSYIPSSPQLEAGWSASVQHRQQWGPQRHWLTLQYGTSSGNRLDGQANVNSRRGDRAWRVVERFDWHYNERLDGQVAFLFQHDHRLLTRGGHWLSLGNRAAYAFNPHFKLALELSADRANPGTGRTGTLTKLTLAPTFVPGKGINGRPYYSRPDVRVYWTHARWNRSAQQNSAAGSVLSDSGVFGASCHGNNVGIQLEYWW